LYSDVDVVIESQTRDIRKVQLVDKNGVVLTYAITHPHSANWTKEIQEVWDQIVEGASIGRSFHANGYKILKTPICTIPVVVSKRIQRLFACEQPEALLHQYKFSVTNNSSSKWEEIATITEIYPAELSKLLLQKQLVRITDKKTLLHSSELKKDINV
jgi:hypothetical protein